MEGRKAAGKLRKKLETVSALTKSRKYKNHIFLLHTTQNSVRKYLTYAIYLSTVYKSIIVYIMCLNVNSDFVYMFG